MKRRKKLSKAAGLQGHKIEYNKADAILTSDLHLSERQPICRLDNYWDAQARKITWLRQLAEKHQCPILDAGDLLDKWKASPFLLAWAIDNLPQFMITIPGNHDIPYRDLESLEYSGLNVLGKFITIKVLSCGALCNHTHLDKFNVYGIPWVAGPLDKYIKLVEEEREYAMPADRHVLLIHTLVWSKKIGKPKWVGHIPSSTAIQLMKRFKGMFDLIVTGDNHQSFSISFKGNRLVNPGSLMRMTAEQINHKPTVYLWYADENKVIPVEVPIEPGEDIISREHIDRVVDRDKRIQAFVERLDQDFSAEFSFEKNLEKFFKKNKVNPKVRKRVWEAVEKK